MLTIQNIQEKFAPLRQAVLDFQADDQAIYISEEVWERSKELAAHLADTEADSVQAKAAALASDEFFIELKKWKQKLETLSDGQVFKDPSGSRKLWNAYGALESAIVEPQYPARSESIKLLLAQGLNPREVAQTYAWRTPVNTPDVHRVLEIIEEAEKHPNKKDVKEGPYFNGIILPKFVAFEARTNLAWDRRQEPPELGQAARDQMPREEAPETLDELIAGRVPLHQICQIKQMHEDAVRERAAELEIPLVVYEMPKTLPAAKNPQAIGKK